MRVSTSDPRGAAGGINERSKIVEGEAVSKVCGQQSGQ